MLKRISCPNLGLTVAALLFVASASCSAPSPPQATNLLAHPGWRQIRTDKFYFYAPSDMKELNARGTDLSLWVYSNERVTLQVQYGSTADPLRSYSDQPHYQQTLLEIDGLRAEQHTFQLDGPLAAHFPGRGEYVSAVHFPELLPGITSKLTMWANCQNPAEQEIALRIFTSIKFVEK